MLLIALLTAMSVHADLLSVDAEQSTEDLSPFLEYRIDSSTHLSLESVIATADADSWQKGDGSVPNFGFTQSAYWFRLRVDNQQAKVVDRLLHVHSALLAQIDVYLVVDGKPLQHFSAGSRLPFRERAIAHRYPVFPLALPAATTADIYLRVWGGAGMQVPLSLWSERDFWIHEQTVLAWDFAYYGLMGVMVLYNLILAWGTRDDTYLYYVIFTAGIGLFQMILHGSAYQLLWPFAPEWNYKSMAVFIPLTNSLASLFIIRFLRIHQQFVLAFRLLLIQLACAPVLVVACLLIPFERVLPYSIFFVLSSAVVIAVVSVQGWRARDQDARYFLVAWLIFIVGCIALALNKMGVLPYEWCSENMMQIGSALETILLSLALTARINRMREEWLSLEREQLKSQELSMQAEQSLLEAKYESKAKSEFLAVMSHEIRTPMNGVLGVVELLCDTALNEKQNELVETIQSSGKLLLNVINDILDFSKIESGKLEFENIAFNVRQLVEETIRFQLPAARQKGLLVATFVDPAIADVLYSDPSRIKQILYNLMSNAIKFTDSGHLFLRVRLLQQTGLKGMLRVEVLDSGIGMTREQKERLFQPFSQADRSTSRRFGGTGLGLAISKKLVEAMGGNIGVESAPRFGSSFWFNLPFTTETDTDEESPMAEREHWYFVSDYVPLLEFIETSLDKKQFAMHSIIVRNGTEVEWPESGIVGRNVLSYIKGDDAWRQRLHWGTLDVIRDIVDQALSADQPPGGEHKTKRPGVVTEALPFSLDRIFIRRKTIAGKPVASMQPAPSRGSNLQHLRVMVAEDNPVNQMVVRGLLRPLVGEVEMVNNGREALDKVKSARLPYDVIFMDCEMPEMDGYEATRRIREHEKRTSPTKPVLVVALTAHAFEEFRDRAYECGMNEHLSKPVTRDMLYQFLTNHYGHLLELDQRSPRFNNDNMA